jgi:hypothetical protein
MDEGLKFVARLLDGEKMAQLCRQFGISRKTGYKILTQATNHRIDGSSVMKRRRRFPSGSSDLHDVSTASESPLRNYSRAPFTICSKRAVGKIP